MSDRTKALLNAGWECVNKEGPTLLWAHKKHKPPLRTTREALEHQKIAESYLGCRCYLLQEDKKDK